MAKKPRIPKRKKTDPPTCYACGRFLFPNDKTFPVVLVPDARLCDECEFRTKRVNPPKGNAAEYVHPKWNEYIKQNPVPVPQSEFKVN